jgi:hypothetical protein
MSKKQNIQYITTRLLIEIINQIAKTNESEVQIAFSKVHAKTISIQEIIL